MLKMKAWLPVVAVLAITGAIVAFVLWDEGKASKRRTAQAEVIGFAATPVSWWDGSDERREEGHTLTFSWVDAGNQPHTRTLERITWYDPERGYKVCYNPQDPAGDWKLYNAAHVCGS